jgi:hypothetical protein
VSIKALKKFVGMTFGMSPDMVGAALGALAVDCLTRSLARPLLAGGHHVQRRGAWPGTSADAGAGSVPEGRTAPPLRAQDHNLEFINKTRWHNQRKLLTLGYRRARNVVL